MSDTSDTVASQSTDRAMLEHPALNRVLQSLHGVVRIDPRGRVELLDPEALRSHGIDRLIRAAVFEEEADVRDTARWMVGELGQALGVRPASIHDLYLARGRGEIGGFTVPAINVRATTFDTGRALFAAARELRVGALICEIARSEIGYTDQRPAEYVASLTAAAIREGWSGPLFVQGDHFQINAKKFAADPDAETRAVRDLIREALHAGFRNIDIDTSTLVDLGEGDLDAQQRANYRLSAELTRFVREHEPDGVTVSIGGEIGEVGTENSTPEELRAYLDGYGRELERLSERTGRTLAGLSKISVQSGTSHGGVVLPDGSIAEVAIDFDTLKHLSRIARDEYELSGAVQHGASTLPAEAFGTFPQVETAEIHLATNFQNLLFDHPSLPAELRERMYEHCRTELAGERGPKDTDEQFIYKTRKKAIGAFKRELWEIPEANREAIRGTLREQFAFLFRQLAVTDTAEMVGRYIDPPPLRREGPSALRMKAAADDWDLSD